MTPTRRGFFRAILALPFAPKCIQAFRRKPLIPSEAPLTAAIAKATADIKAVMGIYDPSMPGPSTSGVAIMAKFRECERMAEAESRDWDADLKFYHGDRWDIAGTYQINPEKR